MKGIFGILLILDILDIFPKALIIDMEITVDQMYNIENKGHDMGFLKKFMMENAGAAAVKRLN